MRFNPLTNASSSSRFSGASTAIVIFSLFLAAAPMPALAGEAHGPTLQYDPGIDIWFDLSTAILLAQAEDGIVKVYEASARVTAFGFGASGIPAAMVSNEPVCAVSPDPTTPESTDVCLAPGGIVGNFADSTGPCDFVNAANYCTAIMCVQIASATGPIRASLPVVIGGVAGLRTGTCEPA